MHSGYLTNWLDSGRHTSPGGVLLTVPSWNGLSHVEQAVRLSRNQHWPESLLEDYPMELISHYWATRFQKAVLAVISGVVANSAKARASDLIVDISGTRFIEGVTNLTEDTLRAVRRDMGEGNSVTGLCMHSGALNSFRRRYTDMKFSDDGFPNPSPGVYDSYLFGSGFLEYAMSCPPNPTAVVDRDGEREFWHRVSWCIHPVGHQFVGLLGTDSSGPTNKDLSNGDNWKRSAESRDQIPFACIRTREF